MRHHCSTNRRAGGGFSSFLVGLLLGAAVGGSVALLLAPRSGAESRHLMSEYLSRRREHAHKLITETRHRAQKSQGNLGSYLYACWQRFRYAWQAGKQAALERHRQLKQEQEGGK